MYYEGPCDQDAIENDEYPQTRIRKRFAKFEESCRLDESSKAWNIVALFHLPITLSSATGWMYMMPHSWQRRRSRFNHDWLKNRYLPAIAKWIHIQEGLVEDPFFEGEFLQLTLPQWEERSKNALDLVDRFAQEMSPRNLIAMVFRRSPAESTQWLGTLVDALWLNRNLVGQWQADARNAVLAATAQYFELKESLEAQPSGPDRKEEVLNRSVAFGNGCQLVARRIEVFPSRLLVT